MTCFPIQSGTGVELYLLIASGDTCAPPSLITGANPQLTITLDNAGDVMKGSPSATITATAPGTGTIAAGNWLQFINSAGMATSVKITQDLAEGGTTLFIDDGYGNGAPANITDASTAQFPEVFRLRENASLNQTVNTVQRYVFEDLGQSRSVATTRSTEIDLSGLYGPLDPSYRTFVEAVADPTRQLYIIGALPSVDPRYVNSGTFQGLIVPTNNTTTIPADGVIEAQFSAQSNGPFILQAPTPT